MQQTMHSYVCGINLRSESSLVCQIYFSRKVGVPEFDTNMFIARKSKYDLMGTLSELVLIYTTNAGIHRLLHDIPRFFIFLIEQLFSIINQM